MILNLKSKLSNDYLGRGSQTTTIHNSSACFDERNIESISVLIEFFHSHHIDYRGLIEKGLAIDATGLNIY